MIYLDNAATTMIAPDVLEEMLPFLKNEYGNAGSIYKHGRTARDAVEKARQKVADFIGAQPEQIIFTSGGTESNNLAILGVRNFLLENGRTEIITSPTEHDSVLKAIKNLCIKDEFYTCFLPIKKDGRVRTVDLSRAISENTGLVSLMYVNNEVGSVNPIRNIGNLCRKNNIIFHTDCVQAAGCYKIDVKKVGCDLLSISGHKIHAPKGSGALFVKDKRILTPLINGGSNQEFGLRGGTENVANIVGLGKACELFQTYQDKTVEYISMLKSLFWETLKSGLKEKGILECVSINGNDEFKTGKVLNLRFDGVDGETLLLMLDTQGVCISSGSACNSYSSEPSHVLLALGLSPEEARDSVRVSFSIDNDEEQVVLAANRFVDCVEVLRNAKD